MAELNNKNLGTLYIQTSKGDGDSTNWQQIGKCGEITFTTCLPFQLPKVKKVEFHNEYATVVYFEDGTVERCTVGERDVFNPEMGYAMCLAKKYMGSYEKFAWSLDKAKHYKNGKKVKKSKTSSVDELTKTIAKNVEEFNKIKVK